MADIFISYASEDKDRVEPLSKALKRQGWSVFWDREIPPGKTWDDIIEEAIESAKCIIVVWTKESVNSGWVRAEAQEGIDREILVPVMFEDVKIPLRFRPVQAANLIGWKDNISDTGLKQLQQALIDILGTPPVEEEEHKRRETETKRKAEEERKQKEAEANRKTEDEQKRKEVKAKIKPDELESGKIKPTEINLDKKTPIDQGPLNQFPSKPRKKSNALKLGVLAGVAVLLIAGILLLLSQQKLKEVWQAIEKLNSQALNLENAIANLDKPEQIQELSRQRDTLNKKVEAFREQANEVGLESQLEQLQDRLKQVQIQLVNKEKELIAARKGKVFVESEPGNATVKILNIDELFQQGMELEPGKYHVKVSSEGYEPQDRWIKLGAGEEKQINFKLTRPKVIANSIGMNFVLIPAGRFIMGSNPEMDRTERTHPVKISRSFYFQKTEVTQGQWKKVMGDNPSIYKKCGDDCPVENVTWEDTHKFIKKLNDMEGVEVYRLPTEAEWEYAARAGTTTLFSFGDDKGRLTDYAWFNANSNKTHRVGTKKPNPWGLYDMHGNVWEWCQDWYGAYYYDKSPEKDPPGRQRGLYRVLRGGGWTSYVSDCRSAYRGRGKLDDRGGDVGFRLARYVALHP